MLVLLRLGFLRVADNSLIRKPKIYTHSDIMYRKTQNLYAIDNRQVGIK
jgi:hypothetical protein